MSEPQPQHYIVRGPEKRRMGFSGRSHPALAQAIAERLKKEHPTNNAAVGAKVENLRDTLVGPVRSYLQLLLLAVLAVLLVACVNLASANLARGAGRARELAIRTVLGAGRGRLARQLLTENVLVALCGGGLGVVLAHWLIRVLLALNPRAMPRAAAIGIDGGVLLFAIGLTLATGILIGLLPAVQVGRADLRAGMTAGGRGTAVGRSGVRRVLVATEVVSRHPAARGRRSRRTELHAARREGGLRCGRCTGGPHYSPCDALSHGESNR